MGKASDVEHENLRKWGGTGQDPLMHRPYSGPGSRLCDKGQVTSMGRGGRVYGMEVEW